MAEWRIDERTLVEFRWFGLWSTPAWLDVPQIRHRDYLTDSRADKWLDHLSDTLGRRAITIHVESIRRV